MDYGSGFQGDSSVRGPSKYSALGHVLAILGLHQHTGKYKPAFFRLPYHTLYHKIKKLEIYFKNEFFLRGKF
jgi:hypothetical protein